MSALTRHGDRGVQMEECREAEPRAKLLGPEGPWTGQRTSPQGADRRRKRNKDEKQTDGEEEKKARNADKKQMDREKEKNVMKKDEKQMDREGGKKIWSSKSGLKLSPGTPRKMP
ncbi:hypothetical protein NDU88_003683 [Pleurodeles waltl]|uniref:Uncharacterized protein n=1 Tax=Pleurodeles waltl TaxID=8319 RepID=A0AAV7MSK3_PLEWA|nr:hypothetical protein NDU88_003683 [Pleurodeles waltl]